MADATASPAVQALFAITPDQATNPIGATLHSSWVNIVEVSVTGTFDVPNTSPMDMPYSTAFFGMGSAETATYSVPELTAMSTTVQGILGQAWWAWFADALVTQAVYNAAMSIRSYTNEAAVTADLANAAPALRGSALASYLAVFTATYQAEVTAALADPNGWQSYRDILTSSSWISAKQLAASDGQWPDADWELFHHAVKLMVLRAAAADVTAVLTQLQTLGLPMPPAVTGANWSAYAQYAPDPLLPWSDLSHDGMYGFIQPSTNSSFFTRQTPEGVADWFINDHPRYYLAPSGSCFTASTRVLLPDGTDRALAEVAPGDEVWTPDGPRAVQVVAEAQRLGRPLHRLAGSRFAFSDSHPFVDGTDARRSLAVHVPRAATFAGGLAGYGLSRLAAGASAAVVAAGGTPETVPVTDVVEVPAGDGDDEPLLDLILEPSVAGFPTFAVGDGGGQPYFLVRSEVLRFEQHPDGTHLGLGILVQSLEATADALADLGPTDTPDVHRAVRSVADRLVGEAMAELAGAEDGGAAGEDLAPIHEELGGLLGAFHGDDQVFDWQLSALQEALVASLLVPLDHAVAGGWRPVETDLDQAVSCAITLHDVVSEGHWPLVGDWTLDVLVDGAVVGTAAVGDHHGLDHHRRVGLTVADAITCEGTHLTPTTLGVRLHSPDGEVLTGGAVVAGDLPSGHRHGSMLLRADAWGDVGATVRFDLRPLCAELARDHGRAAPEWWDDAARAGFSDWAVPVFAARFSELFPAALDDARQSAPRQPDARS